MKYLIIVALLAAGAVNCFAQTSATRPDPLVAKLPTNGHRVQSVAYSPDGELIAAGFGFVDEGGITIWRTADYSEVASLLPAKKDQASPDRIQFSPDGKWLAAATADERLLLWRAGRWEHPERSVQGCEEITDLTFSPNGRYLGLACRGTAFVYDLTSGTPWRLPNPQPRRDPFIGLSFSPQSDLLLINSFAKLEVRKIASRAIIKRAPDVHAVFFGRLATTGDRFVSGGSGITAGEDGVGVWRFPALTPITTVPGLTGGQFALAISKTGDRFAVGGGDYGGGGTVGLWETDSGRELGFARFGHMPIQGLAFSPDDKFLAAASEDGFLLIYDVARLLGPEVIKRPTALCGEVLNEGGSTYLVPFVRVPQPMRAELQYAWKLEVANPDRLAGNGGQSVMIVDWSLEERAHSLRARVESFRALRPNPLPADFGSDYIVFGHIQNPGWNEGIVGKIYGDGTFVVAKNLGQCVSTGNLDQFHLDFAGLRQRLIDEGLLAVGRDPLSLQTDHYGVTLLGLTHDGVLELRTDADDFERILKNGSAPKRDAFRRVFEKEKALFDSLETAGIPPPVK